MFRTRIKSLIALPAMAGVLLLTACQASGGGTFQSAGCGGTGAGRAPAAPGTFGFTFQSSDAQGLEGLVGTFSGTFRDPGACGFRGGVAMRGTGHPVAPDSPLGPPTAGVAGAFLVDYESMNPAYPGSGVFLLQLFDSGQHGPATGDSFILSVLSGPYSPDVNSPGYTNFGTVQLGNITVLQGPQSAPLP